MLMCRTVRASDDFQKLWRDGAKPRKHTINRKSKKFWFLDLALSSHDARVGLYPWSVQSSVIFFFEL